MTEGGLVYHVCNRGSRKGILFETATDYSAFLGILADAVATFDMRIISYCLMLNHWHILLWPRVGGELSRFMKSLTETHASRWRWWTGTVGQGAVYQGRFESVPVVSAYQLLIVWRYVERNPVAAGLTVRAEDWKWSSASRNPPHVGRFELTDSPYPRPDDWLEFLHASDPTSILARFGLRPLRTDHLASM
jgi:putative transposase